MGGVTNGDLRYTLGSKAREGDAGHPMLALYAARCGLVVGFARLATQRRSLR